MSDLKYKTLEELYRLRHSCEKLITSYECKLNGQKTRLEWINKYIEGKLAATKIVPATRYRLVSRDEKTGRPFFWGFDFVTIEAAKAALLANTWVVDDNGKEVARREE